MGPGEGSEDHPSGVGVSLSHPHAGAPLTGVHDLIHVVDGKARFDALGQQVEGQGDDVRAAGSLAGAEERPFHPAGARKKCKLRGRGGHAPVVVGPDAEDHLIFLSQLLLHPFHLVGKDVWHVELRSAGQAQDQGILRGGLPALQSGLCQGQGPCRICAGKAVYGIFQAEAAVKGGGSGPDQGGRGKDLFRGLFLSVTAVEADDGVMTALQGFQSILYVLKGAGREHLQAHALRDQAVFRQVEEIFSFFLTGCGRADLDLPKAQPYKETEDLHLFCGAGLAQGKVPVPQVHAAPYGRLLQDSIRPFPLRQVHSGTRTVFLVIHCSPSFLSCCYIPDS